MIVRWSFDFSSDALTDGGRLRILVAVDDFTLENLALITDLSLTSSRFERELRALCEQRVYPIMVVSGNETELTITAVLNWVHEMGIDWHSVQPGKPT